MKNIFPTRQNVLKDDPLGRRTSEFSSSAADSQLENIVAPGAEKIMLLSAVVGIDEPPRPMSQQEIEALGDVFTNKILLDENYPVTLTTVVDAISNLSGENALPLRKMFLVAEGGQFQATTPQFDLNARLAFSWQRDTASPPDLFLSTVAVADSASSLLQLIAWSDNDGSFHYFERKGGVWGWAGNSFHALKPPSRGKGPFDSHVNGGLVMKELKAPWGHWQSQSSTIPNEAFEPDSEFRTNPLFSVTSGAEELEAIVRTGLRRWTRSRFSTDSEEGELRNVKTYLRQVLTSTSANLASSTLEFKRVRRNSLKLPSSFFFDVDGIEQAVVTIDPFSNAIPSARIEINGDVFADVVDDVKMRVISESGSIAVEGDTHFAFLIPERAQEDTEIGKMLIEQDLISAKFLLSLLMVDFQNPVRSQRRAHLLRYCPTEIALRERLDKVFVEAVQAATFSDGSPEQEFLSYWSDNDILGRVRTDLFTFFEGVQNTVAQPHGVKLLVKLAEFRKNHFRQRLISEFRSSMSQLGQVLEDEISVDQSGNIMETPN